MEDGGRNPVPFWKIMENIPSTKTRFHFIDPKIKGEGGEIPPLKEKFQQKYCWENSN